MADQAEPQLTERLTKSFLEVRQNWERLPKGLRVLLVAVVVLAIAAGAALTVLDKTEEKVLFSGLTQQDAAAILAKLKEQHVPYRLEAQGTTILVPAEKVHDLRLEMAGEGLPIGGGVGFELFDEQRFGMTEFEERMALRRALEGELSRTIARIDTVRSARVHLVLPKKSLLGRKGTAAQGSVILELQAKRELGNETTESIIHLVSSSVEGLSPDQVTIVDTRGRLLSTDYAQGMNAKGLQYQRDFQQNLELRLREMLDQILGPEKSVVRVAGEFDFSNRETQEEHYDPERSVLRSEQRETETSGSPNNGASGTPGVRSNLPGGVPPNNSTGVANSKREMETRNYEVDKVVNHVVGSGATLTKLSVAILVDGKNPADQPFAPRSVEELRKIELAVKSAVGFDEGRGDRVEVQSIPFHVPEEIETPELTGPPLWKELLPVAVGVGVAIFLLIIILSFRKKTSAPASAQAITSLPLPQRVHELETMMQEPDAALASAPAAEQLEPATPAALMGEVQRLFMDESEGASRVIKSWLKETKSPVDSSPKKAG